MANADEHAGWYVWITEGSIIPPEYAYIMRLISAFFMTLAVVPILPIIFLVIYDISLWLWRVCAAGYVTWTESRHQPTPKPLVETSIRPPKPKPATKGASSKGASRHGPGGHEKIT